MECDDDYKLVVNGVKSVVKENSFEGKKLSEVL